MKIRMFMIALVFTAGTTITEGTAASGAKLLIGSWATSETLGDVVDFNAAKYYASYLGEAYRFHKDGGYTYIMVGSGSLVRATVIDKGTYTVDGKYVTVTPSKETFIPAPKNPSGQKGYKNKPIDRVQKFKFSFTDHDTLNLTDTAVKQFGTTTLHRIKPKS